MAIRYLTSRLQEAQSNPRLPAIVYKQMHARALFSQSFNKEELALWNEGNRQQEKALMKIKGLLPSGEEDLMQGKLLGHKEEGVVTMQMVGWSLMGNPMKMCHQNAAHNVPQPALQGEGAVAQAIALLSSSEDKRRHHKAQEKEVTKTSIFFSNSHPQRIPLQDPSQRKEAINVCIPHGSVHVAWRKFKRRRQKHHLPFF